MLAHLDILKIMPVKSRLDAPFGGYPRFTRVGLPNGRTTTHRT